jgi:hypothetical protein
MKLNPNKKKEKKRKKKGTKQDGLRTKTGRKTPIK